MFGPNYYGILGIKPESDSQMVRETINLKIRKLQAQINIPDKKVREAAEKEMRELIEARKILLDPAKRKEYDERIQKTFEARLKETIDPVGRKISTDHLGRPVKIVSPDGRAISYFYDEVGNITKMVDTNFGTITYQYDLMDRLIKITYPDGNVLSYFYDASGNCKSVTYPDGNAIYYNYNPNNWLIEIIAGNRKTRFEYDKVGNLIKKNLPNGIISSYTYSTAGRLTNIIVANSQGSILFSFLYNFDAAGNCSGIEIKSKDSNKKIKYKYDPLYRLIEIYHSNGKKVKYRYDAIGNRLSKQVSSPSNLNIISRFLTKLLRNLGILWKKTNYSYDADNHLIKAEDAELRYNNNGNLFEKKIGNKITQYFYTYDNKLIRIEFPDGTYSEYTYDPLGRRISKRKQDGRTIYYFYDGHNLIQETDDKGHVIVSYTYGLNLDHPISMSRDGKTYYYLSDHLGSIIALTDEAGNIVSEYECDAWGNITKETGDIENPFRFTGREWNEESGLYYYRARYYDPGTGRFISKDPIDSKPIDLQTQNRYIYVNNNPQTYVDPFGLFPWIWGPENWLWQSLHGVLFSIHTPFQSVANFLSGTGLQYLSHAGSVGAKGLAGGLGGAVELTGFIPYFFESDPLIAFKSGVHTATSIVGGMFGSGVGLALGAGFGLGSALLTGGAIAATAPISVPLLIGGVVGGMIGGLAFKHIGKFITHSIETGGQNIFNAIQAHIGGVLFDKAAEIITEVEEINGAYWDDKLGQIVLVGKKNRNMEEIYLPRMDKEHLAVAIRAVFSGDNLGVSIDPSPSYLESGEFPPDGTKMLVKYLGNTNDTLFGAIMFEADKLLKNLSMGVDNETREEISSNAPDFQNELELSLRYGTEKKSAWHRMWFVIDDMRLEMPTKETLDRNALIFGKATLKVKAEYISKEKNPGIDPTAERFARHFTLHFDEFTKEFPVLERLRELAKISAIVKWLKNSGKPVDLSFLHNYEFIEVPTPKDTTGIISSKSNSWQNGNTTHTQTYSLYGGVDFDFQYRAIKDDGEAFALKKTTQKNKPCETASKWDFEFKGNIQKAIAVPMTGMNGNFTTIHTDFSLPSTDRIRLELSRCYDSFNTKNSIFGFGWTLNIPYKLFILNPEKSDSALFLIERGTGRSHKYLYVEKSQAYYLVIGEKEEDGRISFSYDTHKFIKINPEGGFIQDSEDGIAYIFDPQGRLISKVDKNSRRLDYTYEGNRLIKISDSFGNDIRLIYDDNNRVNQIVTSDQTTIDYLYDRYGDLIQVSDNKGNIKIYTYDAEHRLIKAQNGSGRAISRTNYDPLGREIKKRHDVVVDDRGNTITKIYDSDYKLIVEKDKEGNAINYEYDKDKNLTQTVISDIKGRKTILEHDEKERIKNIINPMSDSIRFAYDHRGNIISVTDPNGHTNRIEYDNNNNLISLHDAIGNKWKQEFDQLSRLKSIIDPMGHKVELAYNEDSFIECIASPESTTRFQTNEKGRLTKLIDPNGKFIEYFYDSKGKLIQTGNSLGMTTKYKYDYSGNLTSIIDAKGNRHRLNIEGSKPL